VNEYEKVFDYVGAYEKIFWERASVHAWNQLEMLAAEYYSDERTWDETKKLLDDLVSYVQGNDTSVQ
jgi:hypothetical protein